MYRVVPSKTVLNLKERPKERMKEINYPTFICFISSNICSGGRLATALLMDSGASCGWTLSPYGDSIMGDPVPKPAPEETKIGEECRYKN